ncbi:Gfo/Idh/MocA family protein [Nonomuraea diastatica]|uniref:Gfo/Idh/MocA family protein n=1 Tax=Nonomuraea diastatica TaxID=1848329 RepID=UPI001FE87A20|nr:Gfo/Idh/MocA family oxidoreductase [Nonomuraea diastatica]
MTEVTLAVVGGGLRGLTYARRAHATGAGRVVAVADPDPLRRALFVEEFGIAPERAHAGWKELAAGGRVADAAVIATHDWLHAEPAVTLADLGYHILLEKPMATSEPEAAMIAEAARRNRILLAVCHVLRYTPYTRLVKELVDAGRIGRLVSVQHLEPVGWWHQAHSFVRGHWRRQDTSAPMLLAKACHDIDWLVHLFGRPPARARRSAPCHTSTRAPRSSSPPAARRDRRRATGTEAATKGSPTPSSPPWPRVTPPCSGRTRPRA